MLRPRRVQVVLKKSYCGHPFRVANHLGSTTNPYGFQPLLAAKQNFTIPMNIPAATFLSQQPLDAATIAAGYQPQFWDQYAEQYDYVRVYSSAVKIKISYASATSAAPIGFTTQLFGYENTTEALTMPTWSAANHPMYGKTMNQVVQSPYVKQHRLRYTNEGATRTVKVATKMAKWFGERQKAIVTEGDHPYDAGTGYGNKYLAHCTPLAETAPYNQVWLHVEMFALTPGTASTVLAGAAGASVEISVEYNCEFLKAEDQYVVDELQAA